MKKHLITYFFFFTFFILLNIQYCFSQKYKKRIFTSKNGLSQNGVQSVYEDSKGAIWISTIDGLNRFDGNEFLKYKMGDLGLKTSQINSVVEDEVGNLFIASYIGLYYYDINKNLFVCLSDDNDALKGSSKYMMIDSNGNVWLYKLLDNKLIRIKYDYKKGKIESLYCYNKIIEGDAISGIKQVGSKIVFSGIGGFHFYDLKTNNFKSDNRVKNISSISSVSDSSFLFSIVNEGIYSYNLYTKDIKKCISISGKTLLKIKDDYLYYVNANGLYKMSLNSLNKKDKKIECIDVFHNFSVMSLCISKDNIIWLGILREGVFQYSISNFTLKKYSGSRIRHVSCIYQDNNDDLWLGTEGYGLFYYGKKGLETNYESSCLLDEIVYDVKQSKYDGKYYAAVYFKGVAVSSSKFKSYTFIPNTESARKLLFDNKYLWIALYNKGLLRYNTETKECKFLKISNGLASNIVRNILKDRYGNIWVATDNGLSFIKSDSRFSDNPLIKNPNGKNADKYVLSLLEDRDGYLWIGTIGKGVFQYSFTKSGSLSLLNRYTKTNGLSNNSINDIIEDDKGQIWFPSNYGLQVIDKTNFNINSFDLEDGLQDYEFGELASIKLKSGELLFGGLNGINAINPDSIVVSLEKKTPYLDGFFIDNKSFICDSNKVKIFSPKNVLLTKKIKLNRKQRNFTFQFSALEFFKPSQIKYKYKLKGYDDKWINTTAKERKAVYYNVPIGKYEFLVKASNCNGCWSDKVLKVDVEIEPSFWWCRNIKIVYLILLILLVFLISIEYIKFHKRNKRRIYLENESKISERVLNKRTNFFNSLSHELRIPLTLIVSPLEKIMSLPEYKEDSRLFKAINVAYRNSLMLFNLIDDYLAYSDAEKNKIIPNVENFYFYDYCETILYQFSYLAEKNEIKLVFESDDKDERIAYDKNLLKHIIYNLVSNAIKHTPKGKEVVLSVSLTCENILFSVKDSGDGISKDLEKHIFEKYFKWDNYKNKCTGLGMYFTKQIVENLNGKISFISKVNNGTIFNVSLPLLEKNKLFDLIKTKDDEIEERVSNLLDSDVFKIENAKMLILDTDKDVIDVISDIFSSVFQIIVSSNVYDGLCKAEKYCPDIIITGITSSHSRKIDNEQNDFDYCVKLKKDPKTSHIPIILISKDVDSFDVARVYENMVDILCKKPFHNDTLIKMVESLLKNRKILIEKFSSNLSVLPTDKVLSLSDYDLINKISNILEKNISNSNFSAQNLEEQLGLSRYLFTKKIKEIYGLTPSIYIRDVRLNKASEMLKSGKYLVSEVTLAVGFTDLRYFRESFKNKFGVLPNSYKSCVKNKD